jgi:hypothetical protein
LVVSLWLAEASDALVSVFLPAGCRLKELLTGRERRQAFVVLLPHVQAAELTKSASYW